MKSQVLFLVILLVTVLTGLQAARIGVIYTGGSKSHLLAVMPLVEELAKRGHTITIVSPHKVSLDDTNIRLIHLADMEERIKAFSPDLFGMSKQGPTQIINMFSSMISLILDGHELLMANRELQSYFQDGDFDLFIADALNDFTLFSLDRLKVPIVLHSSCTGLATMLKPMGVSMDYASVPSPLTEFDDQMNFGQRLINAIQSEALNLFMDWFMLRSVESRIKIDYPDSRSLSEIKRDISLLIVNSHPVTDWPRSLPPSVVALGALHTRPAKPLSQEFQTFADEAKDGFIIFTFGSFVPVSSMPVETLQAFMSAFAKLPQRVIWKWEADVPVNVPSNIMMKKWLPQQDLLGHSNVKVFITHGGLLGFQEAAYHGVPMLLLPFGNDQKANAAKAQKEGFGLKLAWSDLDEHKLSDALKRLILSSSFRANATRISRLMRDELMPAKDIGAYWVEHVLRQKGTKHLQLAGKDRPFYQRYLLDVIAFLMGIALMILIALICLFRWVIFKCFGQKSSRVKAKEN